MNRASKPLKSTSRSERTIITSAIASSQSYSDIARTAPTNTSGVGRLRKSISYQNLKTAAHHKGSTSSVDSSSSNSRMFKKPLPVREKLHGSTTNIPDACSKSKVGIINNARPIPHSHQNNCNNGANGASNQKSRFQAHRISVNSDLLSRVEKEKKQYEARISELTQVTENRKMEIEKLSFEVRRTKEELVELKSTYDEVKQTNINLLAKLNGPDDLAKHPTENGITRSDGGSQKNSSIPGFRKPASVPCSPPESLATTTRLTPGGVTTTTTTHTGSLSGDWTDGPLSLDMNGPPDYRDMMLNQNNVDSSSTNRIVPRMGNRSESVASLHGRLLQMEEANHTTNEELQATLQELWDLQRSVDEAHEEIHSLSFERGILLEALSTQTTKLEHCRFQIEQLKHLLLTDRRAQTPESRENHFCELYASIEQEKLVLLGQNNDLAQSSDDLAKKCRVLTEKASQLQDDFDQLENEHGALKSAYQSVYSELNVLKDRSNDDGTVASVFVSPKRHHTNDINVSDQSCPICSTVGLSELKGKIEELEKELLNTREGFEIQRAEHEREATEWRLYERDLLKTVQVADGIKTEAEAKAVRLSDENKALKDQVENLTLESTNLSKQLSSLREKSSSFSSLQAKKATDDNFPLSEVLQNKCAVQDALITNPAQQSSLNTNDNSTNSPFNVRNTATNARNQFAHARSSSLNQYGPYSNSPGAPTRPSCLTNGPTVRSLIQSIENQVKAVQHQKRGLASTTAKSLTNSKGSPAFRFYPHNTCPNTSPTTGSGSNLSNTSLISPTKVSVIKKKFRLSTTNDCSSPTFHRSKENASAPGGPESGLPLKRDSDSTEISARPRTSSSAIVIRSNTLDSGIRPQSAEKKCHVSIEQPDGSKELLISSRMPSSMYSSDLGPTIEHTHTTATLHVPLQRSSSPLTNTSRSSANKSVAENSIQSSAGKESSDTTAANSSFVGVNPVCHDPLLELARRTQAGSKRNALLLWCQSRLINYRGVEVTNFSSSWKSGLALCALLHTYMPSEIPWSDLVTNNGLPVDTKRCLDVAFKAAENAGIPSTLRPRDLLTTDRPDWNAVLSYVTAIYMHYELPSTNTPSSTSKSNPSRNSSTVSELVNP